MPAQPSQTMLNGPPLSRVLEQVDQDEKESELKMQRILADIASYNHIQDELDRDEKALTEHNARMVEEIEKSQHNRDDDKEIEKFAKYQMELLKA
jgi:siderophore synthetase component